MFLRLCEIMLRMALKEFLKHYKESRVVQGQASRRQGSKRASTYVEGIQSEPCPVGACSILQQIGF